MGQFRLLSYNIYQTYLKQNRSRQNPFLPLVIADQNLHNRYKKFSLSCDGPTTCGCGFVINTYYNRSHGIEI